MKRVRVVAYCRVSTDKDDQINSLESQVSFFRKYIDDNDQWQPIEIYVDEGISGTNTNKREAFKKMIGDAERKLFDLILTKEISRFARNTLDSIYYTRKLKDLGIGVIFLHDNINTLDADSELRLTIMSSIAQEESRKTSERVKWGQRRQMEKGVVFGRSVFGYELKKGALTTNEMEASIVRDIFKMYIQEGMGTHGIAKALEDRGIRTKNGGKQWSNAAIFKILKNEKYCGDLIQRKTFTTNYLTHEKKYNKGEEDFVIIKNHHAPIIPKEMFEAAQREMEKRRLCVTDNGKYSNRYVFSGKVKCGLCNGNFVSRTRKRKDGTVRKTWQCYTKTRYGLPHENGQGDFVGCGAKEITDVRMQQLILDILRDVVLDKEKIREEVEQTVRRVRHETTQRAENPKRSSAEIIQLQSKKHKAVDLYFDGMLSKDDLKNMTEKYDKQIDFLQSKAGDLAKQEKIFSEPEATMDRVKRDIKQIIYAECFSEEVCRQVLEKVVVNGKNECDVYIRGDANQSPFRIPNTYIV